ncbi:GAF domain-containing protein [Deinococcus altitudinis]|uniref:GAF domain-containing protein n=1 Tax=Deinococcus altitudinis TaxID=468914 RepID=UPI00389247E5
MTLSPGPDLGPFALLAENLQDITEALAAATTQREVIEIVLTPAVQALGAVAGIVLLVDHTDQQMKIAGSQGYEDVTLTIWQEGPIDDHVLISDILRMREAVYFEHKGALKEAYPNLESRTGALAAVANATLPMFLDHRPLGVIVLDFKEPHTFTPAERRFLRILSAQCAVALGRARATVTLEARVEERTRQLEERTRQLGEERAAQEAFVAFSEAVGARTDLTELVNEAIKVLGVRFPGASVGYYEEEDHLWKARIWSDDLSPEQVAVITAGLPAETPLFAEVSRTRQPVFTDAWDARKERVATSEAYGAGAGYPLLVDGDVQSLFTIGLRKIRRWSEADRALLRSVGRGLSLALERSVQSNRLQAQNAELDARSRALDAFAELTRDLTVHEDASVLIHRAQQVVLSLLPAGYCLYFEPDIKKAQWVLGAQTGDLRNDDLQAVASRGLPYEEAGNLLTPFTTLEPFYQDEYARDTDNLEGMVAHLGASATFPVLVRGQPRGVFAVVLFGARRPWSTVERAVMETVVRSLGLALERAQGIAELAERSRELQQANQDLQVANEELEAFTYSASHDLRTPVRHVMGFAELAQKALEGRPNEQAQRYMDVVKQAALRMSALIDGMLVLSRSGRQELKTQTVDLNDLTTQAQQDVASEFAGQPVRWVIGELPRVQGDPEMLQQVMTNLLSNAVKYSAKRPQSEVEVWSEESASGWTIHVKDNGVGFDPAYAQKLFGIFQRLHPEREFEGTGVGLATVRRIVLKHGGQVKAESQEHSGATFSFTLPKPLRSHTRKT